MRIYKDGETWKTSESFGREDLPLVAKVADMAHTWLYEHGNESENGAAAREVLNDKARPATA